MHQDVYSQAFSGEGAPAWAVCTNGVPPTVLPGRWSRNYTNPGFKVSIDHFFANDVAGDLQGEFDRTWGVVAATFAANPWVIGYDPFNEPYARAVSDAASPLGGADQSAALECLYTGRTDPGLSVTGRRLSCPATVPAEGVIPTIEAADPTHLVFVEPDILSTNSDPDLLGPMPFGRLVYNFHAYCGSRSPVTGDPTDPARCTARIVGLMRTAQAARTLLGSPQQPGGPAWFMSEFGAMTSTATLDPVVAEAQRLGVGWAYWSWKYYGDPTGSSHEALVGPDGSLGPQAESLVRPYAEAVAGRAPIETFDPASNVYTLTYRSDPTVADPTVVMTVPSYRYAAGYCADITGGRIASVAGSPKLVVFNAVGATQVTVELEPGPCDGRG
jgi:endoglycosylceramidase